MSISCFNNLKPGDIVYYMAYCYSAAKVTTFPFYFASRSTNNVMVIINNDGDCLSLSGNVISKIVKNKAK